MEKQFTDNFRSNEFACKYGCGSDHIDLRLVAMVQTIRTLYGKPIYITLGVRCETHNRSPEVEEDWKTVLTLRVRRWIFGCKNSTDRHRLVHLLMFGSDETNRIGLDKTFIHIHINETKPPNVIWTY